MKENYSKDLLVNQHILITGGGSGLGRSMAIRCASLGASVTVCGRREEPLLETKNLIQEQGGKAAYVTCNVRELDAVEQALKTTENQQGEITGLVNNAAANFLSPTELISENGFDTIVKTNLYGSFYMTQGCGKRWIERETKGAIVSISTTYAETGSAFVVPSAVSKAGIEAMTKSLAVEWGTYGIRLNAIQPGPFPTEGAWKRLVPNKSVEDQMLARVPLSRFGKHPELTNLVVFLLSDLSSYMTGAVLTLDGGEVLNAGGQFNELTRLPRELAIAMLTNMRR